MVEIREERPDGGATSSDTRSFSNSSDATAGGASTRQTTSAIAHIKSKPVDTVLWILRILTVIFGLLYAFPIIGGPQQQQSYYSKTLIAGAATNALRLHQRLGGFQLNWDFLNRVFVEDSCHYLFYSIIFLGSYPITMALMPVFLFALLHAASFTIQLLNACGMTGNILYRLLTKLVEGYSQSLLTVIACSEIFIMPMVIVMIFMGRSNILIPFIYYRFLTLRYMSRRNPNTRVAFHQGRMALEQSVNKPRCPAVIRNSVYKMISLVEKLCPNPPAQQ